MQAFTQRCLKAFLPASMRRLARIAVALLCFGWLNGGTVFSQEATRTALTPSFRFNDGIYFSFEECKADRPRYTWQELNGHLVSNGKTLLAKVEKLNHTQSGAAILLDSLWGLSIDGVPYIKVAVSPGFTTFAGFSARGALCPYSFETDTLQKVEIVAYNPVTGRPFRKGAVKNKERLQHTKILRWETGQTADFTRAVFMEWIADDAQLSKTIKDLSPEEAEKKLYKSLLIYNDRHIVYLNK